jgi:hypothetical protein
MPVPLTVLLPAECERWTYRDRRLQERVRLDTNFLKGVAVRPEKRKKL